MRGKKQKYGPTKEWCPICGSVLYREYGGPGIDWCRCLEYDHVSYEEVPG